jgi:hypothetical protein
MGTSLFFSSCAEQVGSGEAVSIPSITVDCGNSRCNQNQNVRLIVRITPFDCSATSLNFAVATGGVENLTCNATSGCFANVSNFVDGQGVPVTKIASGTYTVCGIVDINRDYPNNENQDSTAVETSVSVNANTFNIRLDDWNP